MQLPTSYLVSGAALMSLAIVPATGICTGNKYGIGTGTTVGTNKQCKLFHH